MVDETQADFSDVPAKQEDLIVSGSSCKIYRDDEMAMYINKGRPLAAWNGDINLMIDIYDARHYLDDLEQYEAKPDSESPNCLSEYEEQVENLCDEERYLELRKDLVEEEERRRLRDAAGKHDTYHDLAITYDVLDNMDFVSKTEGSAKKDFVDHDDGHSFLSSSGYVSGSSPEDTSDYVIPAAPGIKQNIDKFAEYVARNGQHFENIAKNRNHHRYKFLDPSHEHHQYYLITRYSFLRRKELSAEDVVHQYQSDAKVEMQRSSQKYNDGVKFDSANCINGHLSSPRELSSDERKSGTEDAISICSCARVEIETSPHGDESADVKNEPAESETYKLVADSPESCPEQKLKKQLQVKRRRQAAAFVNMLKRKAENAEPEGHSLPSNSRSGYRSKSKSRTQSWRRNDRSRARSH